MLLSLFAGKHQYGPHYEMYRTEADHTNQHMLGDSQNLLLVAWKLGSQSYNHLEQVKQL